MAEPKEFIRIQPLARGFRIDMTTYDPASGEYRKVDPTHYATRDLADQFAEMMHQATGLPIIEGTGR